MRWIVKEDKFPNPNEIRIVRKFAILPIQINAEKRWLETVYIKQQYEQGMFAFSPWEWNNKKFVSSIDYDSYVNDCNKK